MKKVFRLAMLISMLALMAGCGEKEQRNSGEYTFESEVLEQEMNDLEVSESESFENETASQEESDVEISALEALELEIFEEENVQYIAEDYGEIQEYGSEFYYDEDTKGFYYNMEMFFLGSDFLYTMNDTLQEFYDGYLRQYQENEEWYLEQGAVDVPEEVPGEVPEERVPYSELLFLGIQYIDNDYVSLLFNDVTYMGGAHPYSMYDAITIDRCTGKEVTSSEILGESDTEILEKVSDLMGLDVVANWEDIDFYLQEGRIVFIYRMPNIWEDVVLGR